MVLNFTLITDGYFIPALLFVHGDQLSLENLSALTFPKFPSALSTFVAIRACRRQVYVGKKNAAQHIQFLAFLAIIFLSHSFQYPLILKPLRRGFRNA